jgi:hypothetical protein
VWRLREVIGEGRILRSLTLSGVRSKRLGDLPDARTRWAQTVDPALGLPAES